MRFDRLRNTIITAVMIVSIAFAAVNAVATSLNPRQLPVKPLKTKMLPGSDRKLIKVKFMDDREMVKSVTGTPQDQTRSGRGYSDVESVLESITLSGGTWRRVTEGMEREADSLREKAQISLGQEIGRMNNYFNLYVPDGESAAEWIDQLNALEIVELAYAPSLPCPPPVAHPDYTPNQGYLDPSTTGLGAEQVWNLWGGKGANVFICDLEFGWNLDHMDISASVQTLMLSGYTALPGSDEDHGTAVIGILNGREPFYYFDGVGYPIYYGITGMAPDAGIKVSPVRLRDNGTGDTAYHIDAAITNVLLTLNAGDVILLELQVSGPRWAGNPNNQFGMIPVEWESAIYTAIRTAVGLGVHVVEAAGNGYQDLDDPIYDVNHRPFLPANNSGAIMVGAGNVPGAFGGADTPRSRMGYSNYGSRLDVQGWGDRVFTSGYNYWDTLNTEHNEEYTDDFGGTSAASAMVAGAAGLLESIHEGYHGSVVSPANLRAWLIAHGAPQQAGSFPVTEHIGPLPDLFETVRSIGCGGAVWDCNNDGIPLGSGDLVELIEYVLDPYTDRSNSRWLCGMEFNGFANPFFPCEPTFGDLVAFHRYFRFGIAEIWHGCPGIMMPVANLNMSLVFPTNYSMVSPPMSGIYTMQLENTSAVDIDVWGVVVPLSFSFDLVGATAPLHFIVINNIQTYGIWDEALLNSDPFNQIVVLLNSTFPVVVPANSKLDLFDVVFTATSGSQGTFNTEFFERPPGFFRSIYTSPTGPAPAVGEASVPTIITESILGIPTSSECCGIYTFGYTGNADCSDDGRRNLADITRLIDRVYVSKVGLCCEENGNTDGDELDKINLADITALIDHVYVSKLETAVCE